MGVVEIYPSSDSFAAQKSDGTVVTWGTGTPDFGRNVTKLLKCFSRQVAVPIQARSGPSW